MKKVTASPASAAAVVPPQPTASDSGHAATPATGATLDPIWQVLRLLSSLKLTVVLFVLALVLIFAGTLAQVDEGIWTALRNYFRSFVAWIPFQALARFAQVFVGVKEGEPIKGSFPFPGGFTLGLLMLVNLLAAHLVRFKVSWKRSGILILHAGVVLLLLGEGITGLFAVEGRMTIENGGQSNYVEDHHQTELAILSRQDDRTDQVTVVPASRLKRGGTISSPELPFDIEVVRYMVNSASPRPPRPGEENPATAGDGLKRLAEPRPEVSGADPNQSVDMPSAYLTFKRKDNGEVLGTYLVSTWWSDYWLSLLLERPQKVELDGKTYTVMLRAKRSYKPYTIHLKEFRHDLYLGTTTPKNFSSRVVLDDPKAGVKREVLIAMNEPMLHGGETFFQSGWLPGDKGTILQVVWNPAKWLPYISCTLVAVGLLVHFGIMLREFLKKGTLAAGRAKPHRDERGASPIREADGAAVSEGGFLPKLQVYLPWVVLGLAVLYVCSAMVGREEGPDEFHLTEFSKLPVVDGGRVKPLDTVARVNLMVMSGRQEFRDDSDRKQPAIRWLLDVMTSGPIFKQAVADGQKFPLQGEEDKVFRIENDQLRQMMELPAREGLRYSIREMEPKIAALFDLADNLDETDPKKRDAFQVKALELAQHLKQYIKLSRFEQMLALPPAKEGDEEWQPILGGAARDAKGGRLWATMLAAYAKDEPRKFNQALEAYRVWLDNQPGSASAGLAGAEVFFNRFAPFYHCAVLYVCVFVLCCLSWLFWREPLQQSAFWLAVFVLAVHTGALLARMIIQGRPPVTNLYSSAVFIGWGCLALGVSLDVFFRRSMGVGTLVASVLGFLTMILANYLGGSGDTMEMMQAVLDTNFWLATHVVAVTLGYVATLVAAVIGVVYIVAGRFTRALSNRDTQADLMKMLYGTICFATLLSFVGTVLGGIWADQSWGRFWGWDPKENGAVLIVIMNALILHARWAGMIKHRGVALLSVVGAMVTIWSWFGTNQLGVGLHAYGFNNALVVMCNVVWVFCLVVLAIGSVPLKRWRSFATPPAAPV